MNKKVIALISVFVLVLLLLASCGPATNDAAQTELQAQVDELQAQLEDALASGEASEAEIAALEEQLGEAMADMEAPAEEPAMNEDGKTLIVWWSHWANEPGKKAVIETIVADYEAEHPDVDIVLTWWDKNPLRDAIRSTMTAGEGAPDITTFDTAVVEWVTAGWLLDLSDTLPWDNFIPAAKGDGVYPGVEGNYKLNIGFLVDMLLYNPAIFDELSIEVPEDLQFTQDEFIDVVEACRAGGYSGVADAAGNRPYVGRFPIQAALVQLVGIEEFGKYIRGEQSWDTPEVRQVLSWVVEASEAGMWPDSYSTMTIDEYHVYFHTLQKACMLYNPTWYTGRAFAPEASGGQSPDFQFGMLKPPLMDGAQFPDAAHGGFESGYGILSSTKHPEVAKDILKFMSQPKYGALWVALTNSPTSILYDKATDWPSDEVLDANGVVAGQWDWYWDEFNSVYLPMDVGVTAEGACGDFQAVLDNELNVGLQLGLITVDEAITTLDANLCQ